MKGETCKYPYKAEPPCDFIPRTHEGCDYDIPPMGIWFDCISIHAPMKGATYSRRGKEVFLWDFNPRTHEGCDSLRELAKEVRHYFNPRTHEGCDVGRFQPLHRRVEFQSTHP